MNFRLQACESCPKEGARNSNGRISIPFRRKNCLVWFVPSRDTSYRLLICSLDSWFIRNYYVRYFLTDWGGGVAGSVPPEFHSMDDARCMNRLPPGSKNPCLHNQYTPKKNLESLGHKYVSKSFRHLDSRQL